MGTASHLTTAVDARMRLPQDLHIHTTFSTNDASVVEQQTVAFIAAVQHAHIVGISDHFENLLGSNFAIYRREVRRMGLKLGVEVDGHPWCDQAIEYDVDYYIAHCRDQEVDYRCLEILLTTGRPVIVAHPNMFATDLSRVPPECLIEINNRYIWRTDWKAYYMPYKNRFKFIISSDAHQPNWLGQTVARHVAAQLGVSEHILFK